MENLLGWLMIAGAFGFPLMLAFSLLFPKAAIFWMRRKTKKKAIVIYSSLSVASWVFAIILGSTSPTLSETAAIEGTASPTLSEPAAIEPLTSSNFEGEWPFSVDGEISCISQGGDLGHVILKTDSGTYALNGLARESKQYLDIFESPVWKPDPETPGLKVNIGSAISAGLERCS